jgi:mono/diheme cytochrome c family protein|tara:strand:- start:2167 stop:2589 length:423 start_codon:yes stop_codon:yes gene_type:complete
MKSVIAFSALAVIFGLASALWLSVNNSADDIIIKNVPTNVLLPDTLSQNAQIGKLAFEAKCTSCHGTNAAGRDGVAPPLVHIIYESNHHGDESFQRAVAMGVQAHHWSFGNMPAVEGLTRGDVMMIIKYIRELQRENGIN